MAGGAELLRRLPGRPRLRRAVDSRPKRAVPRRVDPGAQDELATESIGLAAKAVAGFGGTVLIEPVAAQLVASLKAQGDGGLDHLRAAQEVAQHSGGQQPSTGQHARAG